MNFRKLKRLFHQQGGKFAHALTGSFLYLLHTLSSTNGIRIDEVDRSARTYIVNQSGSRIDI